jgi:hypothetical protein
VRARRGSKSVIGSFKVARRISGSRFYEINSYEKGGP